MSLAVDGLVLAVVGILGVIAAFQLPRFVKHRYLEVFCVIVLGALLGGLYFKDLLGVNICVGISLTGYFVAQLYLLFARS